MLKVYCSLAIMMMPVMMMLMMMTTGRPMTMMKRLRLMYNHLLMMYDASLDTSFDDFAKHDRQTD